MWMQCKYTEPTAKLMTENRLTSLALMHIHYDHEVNLDTVVDLFAELQPKRLQLRSLLFEAGWNYAFFNVHINLFFVIINLSIILLWIDPNASKMFSEIWISMTLGNMPLHPHINIFTLWYDISLAVTKFYLFRLIQYGIPLSISLHMGLLKAKVKRGMSFTHLEDPCK